MSNVPEIFYVNLLHLLMNFEKTNKQLYSYLVIWEMGSQWRGYFFIRLPKKFCYESIKINFVLCKCATSTSNIVCRAILFYRLLHKKEGFCFLSRLRCHRAPIPANKKWARDRWQITRAWKIDFLQPKNF